MCVPRHFPSQKPCRASPRMPGNAPGGARHPLGNRVGLLQDGSMQSHNKAPRPEEYTHAPFKVLRAVQECRQEFWVSTRALLHLPTESSQHSHEFPEDSPGQCPHELGTIAPRTLHTPPRIPQDSRPRIDRRIHRVPLRDLQLSPQDSPRHSSRDASKNAPDPTRTLHK